MKAAKVCFPIYFFVVILDQFFIWIQKDNLRWLTKPLLMPLLIIVVSFRIKRKKVLPAAFVATALLFSWCGDVFLQASGFFIPGLLDFLLAHFSYIFYFLQVGKGKKGLLQMRPMLALPVVLYIFLLMSFLLPHLGALRVPVFVYSLTIGTMLLLAVNTRRQIFPAISAGFIAGALLFVLSDSVLALNLFISKQWQLGSAVMATYAAAQYLLVKGALRNEECS